MDIPAFVRQDQAPLYPKVLWNRPVSRRGAGRLLVPGGHSGEFSLPTSLYQVTEGIGVGECTVALPDALVRLLSGASGVTFLPSSTSGSLGQEALGQLLHLAEDADAVMLGASLSNHSQTTVLVEKFIRETSTPLVLFEDTISLMERQAQLILSDPQDLLILTMPQVFKLAGTLAMPIHIKPGGGLINKLEIIRDLSAHAQASFVVWGSETIIAVPGRELVVTPLNYRMSQLPALIYATLATFWVQNPGDRYAGLATAAYLLRQVGNDLPEQSRPSLTAGTKLLRQALEQAEDAI